MYTHEELDILARTMYGEARGEYAAFGYKSLKAVAQVIMNRLKKKYKGNSIIEICKYPYQFSCWNPTDSNFKIISEVSDREPIFKICYEVAKEVVCFPNAPDLTKGAEHYYSAFLKSPPIWSCGKTPTITIGNHIFFNLIGG